MEADDLADYTEMSELHFLPRSAGTEKATCTGKTISSPTANPFSQHWKSLQSGWLSRCSGSSSIAGTTATVAGV